MLWEQWFPTCSVMVLLACKTDAGAMDATMAGPQQWPSGYRQLSTNLVALIFYSRGVRATHWHVHRLCLLLLLLLGSWLVDGSIWVHAAWQIGPGSFDNNNRVHTGIDSYHNCITESHVAHTSGNGERQCRPHGIAQRCSTSCCRSIPAVQHLRIGW